MIGSVVNKSNELVLKKLFKKQLCFLCNAEYSLSIILSFESIINQYYVTEKYKFFEYSMMAFSDSLWKSLFCIVDKDKNSYNDKNYSIFELVDDLKQLNVKSKQISLYSCGEYKQRISYKLFLKRFDRFIRSKSTEKIIKRIKTLRNTFSHPIQKYMLNPQSKVKICYNKGKKEKININIKDHTIYNFIKKVKEYYFTLAKYYHIDTNFYDKKIFSQIDLDNILDVLEENYNTLNKK